MSSPSIITQEFLETVSETGSLAQAMQRLKNSITTHEPLPLMSTWELVCEEVLDTTYNDDHYERVVAELFRRGLGEDEIKQMRVFAWRTAGWMNYEKMVWDWVSLTEFDIFYALNWMRSEDVISQSELETMRAYAQRYASTHS